MNGDEGTWRVDPLGHRVRVRFGDQLLVDTEGTLRVIEDPHEVRYYVPLSDVRTGHLREPRRAGDHQGRGPATVWTVDTGSAQAAEGAWSYDQPAAGRPDLRGHVCFAWHAMDRMVEEDEEVSVHPRNPHVRSDVFASSRRVRIELEGQTLADTTSPRLLVESYQPNRWYIPADDVRVDLLASPARTECPYKGLASYWSVALGGGLHRDLAWSYPNPRDPAVRAVADCVGLPAELLDTFVDGVLIARPPVTPEPAHLVGDWVRATM